MQFNSKPKLKTVKIIFFNKSLIGFESLIDFLKLKKLQLCRHPMLVRFREL